MTPGLDSIFEQYPEVLTVAEVADLLRMTKPGTYRWLKTGVIPGYQIESSWFVFRDELKELLKAGANTAQEPGGDEEQDSAPAGLGDDSEG